MTTKLITHEPEGDFSYFQNLLCLFVPFNFKESYLQDGYSFGVIKDGK